MKNLIIIVCLFVLSTQIKAQVKVDVGKKVESSANRKANQKTDEAIDKTFDKLEEGIGSLFGKKKKKSSKSSVAQEKTEVSTSSSDKEVSDKAPVADKVTMNWSKFDFVPGDEVIFSDAPDIDEENGEFPTRWDLKGGQVEIVEVDGEKVIAFFDGSPEIVPYLKNAETDYLPDVFTIEFDIYRPAHGNRFFVYLWDRKRQRSGGDQEIEININSVAVNNVTGEYAPARDRDQGRWMHVSIAYTKGKMKVYLDDTRLINIPHYEYNPTGLSVQCYFADVNEDKIWYLKNVRIAKGGVKYYDRVLSDGKIVCNGIRFDVNKATLKPESMGQINEIYELMQKNADLKFSVEGHTDSDGDDLKNQSLSEIRAQEVMNTLIKMGIDSSRLQAKGFGESVPLNHNATPEEKASNRRVEFVKI
ncbi:OmpA family protein [Carboxylicivirga linearis]|uniref:OmpA family protein n=1 Tax=Carboxylicivirga linearis TaxID=1628157 RepID=A0ABS5JX38_9BACT|nr:OmpA family protein [Carboxylicivirga linearis]MBS2099350.1 OmpA family protein [Carboxylicivirga linearis]